MYQRRTKDVWSTQVDYGWGFEEVSLDDNWKEALQTYRDYVENVDRPVRLIKRRVKK